jgi:hypothetical protein
MRTSVAPLLGLTLFAGMLLLLEAGRRLGVLRGARDYEGARAGLAAVEGATFALLGLLIAFTFSGAAGRFEARRDLIVQEANAIGTAWLRIDLLPEAAQPELREAFRRYLDSRLETYAKLPDLDAARAELARGARLQEEIWSRVVAACALPEARYCVVVFSALNEMIDITTTRAMASENHPPVIIFVLLFALALGCSLMAGFAMSGSRERPLLHMTGFAAIMALSVYVILDLEYPRLGWIRVDAADHVLRDLRATMD